LKGIHPFAVAATFVVATALPSCGSSTAANHGDAGSTGGSSHSSDAGSGAVDSGGPQAMCATDDDCSPESECTEHKCVARVVCPTGLEATFDSIQTKVFAVSCGTDGGICHSPEGSTDSAGLNLKDDPYTALLGSDGKGANAVNLSGSVKGLKRVVPGKPDESFIVIKLGTRVNNDPKYGSGMPFPDPGSVCADTLATVRSWIADGAKK
jgi:hypothetical protein